MIMESLVYRITLILWMIFPDVLISNVRSGKGVRQTKGLARRNDN